MFSDFNSYNQYYGINNGMNPNTGFIDMSNVNNNYDMRNTKTITDEEIITMSQSLQLIRKFLNSYGNDELFYRELIPSVRNERAKEIIEEIRNDDRRHNNLLKEVYYYLTGQMVPIDNYQFQSADKPNVSDTNEQKNKDIKKQYEILFFDKLDNVPKYRKIMSTMPAGELYSMLMAIVTDEIKNSIKLNYLIHSHME